MIDDELRRKGRRRVLRSKRRPGELEGGPRAGRLDQARPPVLMLQRSPESDRPGAAAGLSFAGSSPMPGDPPPTNSGGHAPRGRPRGRLPGGRGRLPRAARRSRPARWRARCPPRRPREPEPLDAILDDYLRLIEPNITHWNHPGFLAYFAITGSGPGILGEALAAALNVNAMLWRTSPAATELEERVCDWLRADDGPAPRTSAATSTTRPRRAAWWPWPPPATACRLEVRAKGLSGRPTRRRSTVYASDQAHSSIDKAAIVLGLGQENVRRVASDEDFRMSVPALEEAIARDRAEGRLPMAVVATAGTTSTTSVDPDRGDRRPLRPGGDLAPRGRRLRRLGRHLPRVPGPDARHRAGGLDRGQSRTSGCSRPSTARCSSCATRRCCSAAFSLVPEYLRTDEPGVTNLMDLGFQLGRRFRSLKLWMVIRAFGVEGPARAHPRALRHGPGAGGVDRGRSRASSWPRRSPSAPSASAPWADGSPRTRTASTSGSSPGSTPPGPFFLSHTSSRAATPCGWRSATSGRPGPTSRRCGTSWSAQRPSCGRDVLGLSLPSGSGCCSDCRTRGGGRRNRRGGGRAGLGDREGGPAGRGRAAQLGKAVLASCESAAGAGRPCLPLRLDVARGRAGAPGSGGPTR